MSKPDRTGSIEIAEDMDFQRRSWKVQRVGWVVMLTAAIAALLGAFGGGPLSSGSTGSATSGIRIAYERFPRLNAPETLDIEVSPDAAGLDSVRVWISREWIDSKEVSNIMPEPEAMSVEADRVIYVFRGATDQAPLRFRFNLENRSAGFVRGAAGLVGGPSRAFDQFAYP